MTRQDRWLWEREGWPEVTYDAARLLALVGRARRAQGLVIGAIAAIDPADRRRLRIDALSADAVTTSQIEGETLDPASVRRSIARRLLLHQLGRRDPRRRESRAAEGVSALTVDAVEGARRPVTISRLLRWHRMLRPAGLDAGEVGSFRTGPMQVVSGPIARKRVHFVAPPGERVEPEVRRFVAWFSTLTIDESLIAAALSDLVFVTIHPFEDGNGRIARAVADLVLARDAPDVPVSMTRQILVEKQRYYDVLERTQRGSLDVTEWVAWFLECYERAALHTVAVVAEVQRANAIFTYAAKQGLNDRQRRVLRVFLDRYDGRLTPAKYAQMTGTSVDTAQRDLADLVAKGVLVRTGATSRVSYDVSPTLAPPRADGTA